MKEYREYLNPTQKELVKKILKTFINALEEDEFMDGEAFHAFLQSMNDHLETYDYILLTDNKDINKDGQA